jgi:hypothetical protein
MSSHRIVPTDKFIEVCGIVQSAFSEIASHGIPADVLRWKSVVENRLKKSEKNYPIAIEGFEPQGPQIKGQLLRYEDHAKIFYSTGEPVHWQRFISAKELAHLLIDTPKEYTKKPSSLMSQLIAGIPIWVLQQDPHQDEAAFESEKLAIAAAIEMLVPWKFRGHFDGLCDKGWSNYEIAVEFKVPKYVVSNMLTPSYRPLSKLANESCHCKSEIKQKSS